MAISQPGEPDVLQLAERPTPVLQDDEVLIRVHAAGVNRADLLQREGKYPAPAGIAADVPGLEVAGTVTAKGPRVGRWKVGDAVCALLAGGGYAEFVAAPGAHCLPVPERIELEAAAALPEATFTVWSNVFQRGRLASGERFLVHGGTSGIGLCAIQLAAARGAIVFATAGSEAKCAACREAGAQRAIHYRQEDFEAVLKAEGVDVILDMIGGDYTAKNLRLLRPDGRLVFINAMNGARSEFDALQVMQRRLTITGSTLRTRDSAFKAALAQEVEREVWPLVSTQQVRPNIFRTFHWLEAAAAHRVMQSSEHIGKLVLRVAAP